MLCLGMALTAETLFSDDFSLYNIFIRHKAQNPLHQFPRNFPADGEAANLLPTCPQQVRNKSVM